MNINMNNPSRRLFIAIPLLNSTKEILKKNLPDIPGNRVPENKWHITIEFLGNVEEEKLPLLYKIIQELNLPSAFEMVLNKIGAFPENNAAIVLWMGLEDNETLNMIKRECKKKLKEANFILEDRPFIPHITLSRFSRRTNIISWYESHPLNPISTQAEELILYESLNNGSLHYYVPLLTRSLLSRK